MNRPALVQGLRAALLCCTALSAPAWAAPTESVATTPTSAQQRAAIAQERQGIDQALLQAQAACYQRFAVEDCLQRAHRQARSARALLRQRESALDAAQRLERATQRRHDSAEREAAHPAPVPSTLRGATADGAAQAERDRQAVQRARAQQEKRAAHQAGQAAQTQGRTDGAARARQNQEAKRQTAQQRRARVLQSQADRAAAGHNTPEPLPTVP